MSLPSFPVGPLQVLEGLYKVCPEPSLLQAEEPQLSACPCRGGAPALWSPLWPSGLSQFLLNNNAIVMLWERCWINSSTACEEMVQTCSALLRLQLEQASGAESFRHWEGGSFLWEVLHMHEQEPRKYGRNSGCLSLVARRLHKRRIPTEERNLYWTDSCWKYLLCPVNMLNNSSPHTDLQSFWYQQGS